ncbi:hypothetical protein [Dyadobacter psychrotolerans]|uniref:Uncharacterized protein n=1 Tax=Dyadobacter psychrotolerans TaxID=2541721 RepID=A0A4R5DD35_9BACT|nr:hypothetical protein [Dyadobacter psychrotolerans]TDE09554.1 hypothetical protein E0F88_30150 [Dyadobacter psychrotolerans]
MRSIFDKVTSEIFAEYPDYDLKPSDESYYMNGAVVSFVINSEPPKGLQISYYLDLILEIYILPELILDRTNQWAQYKRFANRGRHFGQTGGNAFKFQHNAQTGTLQGQDILNIHDNSIKVFTEFGLLQTVLDALGK